MADDEIKKPAEEAEENMKKSREKEEAETLIDKANTATERQEQANKETARLMDEQKKMEADKAVGGKTEAGSKEMSEDEKIEADAKKLLKGTGFEEDLFPNKKGS